MTTTPVQPRIAPVARRVGAFAIDLAVAAAVAGGVWAATGEPVLAGLALVQVAVALCVWESRTGLTVGNAACRIRTVRVEGPYAPGIRRGALRALVVGAGFLGAGLGQWVVVSSGVWDRRQLKQGWHDAVANTVMIDVARQPQPVQPWVQRPTQPQAPEQWVQPSPAAALQPVPQPGQQHVRLVHAPAQPAAATGAPEAPVEAPVPVAAATPPTRAAARAAAQTGQGAHLLSFDNGQSFTVVGAGLVGRSPQALPGAPDAQLLEIVDEDRSVSKTHLQFGVDEQGFWVSDLGSTNGTSVLTPHGEPLDVVVGVRVYVPADGSVRVGQRQFTARPAR
ncbi:Forkhead associated (FHA) domain, binds pSer, pThr, pTyr [Sanguibacter gelidistatuariae]|uniref:Forkhead associated (FHA) domain, binds pSer, pThr, pTyr n=1 Tax=Sanguibacter gelidistatuariae TaxID=1814289 RepID=A0A1G6RYU7_9MICO|nr:RDD family protein [Sanguibacter gelidistatuariae]SDD09759.1 Forkhead associated (FHA) domain, binds pSer, pThr, pTyr [Sanguibacter gelidistatuariae]